MKDYAYEAAGGKGIRIYIVDTGLQKSHPEFSDISKSIKWIYPGPHVDKKEDDSDSSHGHGTCMASVALGKRAGVAKHADLTVARIRETELGIESHIDALVRVYDDIHDHHKNKAVVSMSNGASEPHDQPTYLKAARAAYATVLKGLIHDLGAPVTVSAGQPCNIWDDGTPQTLPTILNRDDVPDLTVVGGVELSGIIDGSTFEDEHTFVHGPSDEVTCAMNHHSGYNENSMGTSPATAMTAGLISYHMSLGKNGAQARAQVKKDAYERKGKNPRHLRKALYNGIGKH